MTATSSISGAEARRAARNAGAIAAASILSKGLLFGWQLILAPGLGPAAYGIYGAVLAFVQVGTAIPNFGMGPIFIRDIARAPDKAGKYLASTLVMQTVLALVAYVGVNAAAWLGGYDEAVRVFVALAGINLIIDILGNMCNDLLLAQERMAASSLVTVLHIAGLIALAWLGLAAGYNLFGVYVAAMIAGCVRTVVLWGLVLRSGVRPEWPFDKRVAWPLLLNGAPLALSAFLALAYSHVDKLLTNRFIGDAATGYLSLAYVIIVGVVEVLNTTILTATYPLMSRAYGDGNSPTFGFLVEKLAFFTTMITLPAVLALSIFAPEITVPLFGQDFRPAADVLRILIWYALLTMFVNVLAQGMMVQNNQRRLLAVRAIGLAVNIALLALLLPVIGVTGAAVSSVCAEALVLILLLRRFRAAGWDGRRLPPRLLRLAAAGVMCGVVILLAGQVHVLVGLAGGLAAFTAAVLGLRVLATDDWDLLYRLVAAMPGGGLARKYWRRDAPLNW